MDQPIFEYQRDEESATALLCYNCSHGHESMDHGTTTEVSNKEINARYAAFAKSHGLESSIAIDANNPIRCDRCSAKIWGT